MSPIQLSRLQIIVPFKRPRLLRCLPFKIEPELSHNLYKCGEMHRAYLLTSSQIGKEMRNYLAVYRSLSNPRSGSLLSFRDSYLNSKFQSAFLQSRFFIEHFISPTCQMHFSVSLCSCKLSRGEISFRKSLPLQVFFCNCQILALAYKIIFSWYSTTKEGSRLKLPSILSNRINNAAPIK